MQFSPINSRQILCLRKENELYIYIRYTPKISPEKMAKPIINSTMVDTTDSQETEEINKLIISKLTHYNPEENVYDISPSSVTENSRAMTDSLHSAAKDNSALQDNLQHNISPSNHISHPPSYLEEHSMGSNHLNEPAHPISDIKAGGEGAGTQNFSGMVRQQLKNHQLMYVESDEVERKCDICLEKFSIENDHMVFCDLCNVAVHQGCYGGDLIPFVPNDNWFCERCKFCVEQIVSPDQISCSLCTQNKGCLKNFMINNKEEWVHISCVNWMPDLWIEGEQKEKVTGKVHHSRLNGTCFYCHQKGKGALINCDFKPSCVHRFHIRCAIEKGTIREYFYMAKFQRDFDEPDFLPIYCCKHLETVIDNFEFYKVYNGASPQGIKKPPPKRITESKKDEGDGRSTNKSDEERHRERTAGKRPISHSITPFPHATTSHASRTDMRLSTPNINSNRPKRKCSQRNKYKRSKFESDSNSSIDIQNSSHSERSIQGNDSALNTRAKWFKPNNQKRVKEREEDTQYARIIEMEYPTADIKQLPYILNSFSSVAGTNKFKLKWYTEK